MSGKPVISASRMRDVIIALDGGANVLDLRFGDEQRSALRKAMRFGYLRPARFSASAGIRPAIAAYAVTPDGRDFLRRVECGSPGT